MNTSLQNPILQAHLAGQRDYFNTYLAQEINTHFPALGPLSESIHYSLLAPGKRVRPLLILGVCQAVMPETPLNDSQAIEQLSLACAASVEMIHTYSLIHDDLPSMDNDDYRRGRLTNHKMFGEAFAILSGDALLNLAPQFLLEKTQLAQISPKLGIDLAISLLKASGHQGMIAGQVLDIHYEKNSNKQIQYTKEELQTTLKTIHHLKTGALIEWSCLAGLKSAYAFQTHIPESLSSIIQKVGKEIGILFQVIDDILDETSTQEELGKTPGKDAQAGKLTYTTLYGQQQAKEIAKNLINSIDQSIRELKNFNEQFSRQEKWNTFEAVYQQLKSSLR